MYLLVIFMILLSWSTAVAQTQPWKHRGTNLISVNPNINGTSGWLNTGGSGDYDATQSRTADGSGSWKLRKGFQIQSVQVIPVTAGLEYTMSAYIKQAWEPGFLRFVVLYANADGSYKRGGPSAGESSNGSPNTWEEISNVFIPDPGETHVIVQLWRVDGNTWGEGGDPIWVDDLYVGLGLGFGDPPAAKIPFNGLDVEVDVLGNVKTNVSGSLQPFFPMCIFADVTRADWSIYSTQGFNCNMWGDIVGGWVQKARDAVSAFNPNGLMTAFQFQTYMPGSWYYQPDDSTLKSHITTMNNHPLKHTHFLGWYWDNENGWNGRSAAMVRLGTVNTFDRVGGVRTKPMYVLQGSYNAARTYSRDVVSGNRRTDITGAYSSGGAETGGSGAAGGQAVLTNQQNQDIPVVFFQMNISTGAGAPLGELRRLIYSALGQGIKGFGIWADCLNPAACNFYGYPVDTAGWWPDLPNMRREIDALIPFIRAPHWTTWTATTATTGVVVATRDYNGKGHLILANQSHTAAKTFTVNLSGLPYTATQARNYFTNTLVTNVSGGALTVTLPALSGGPLHDGSQGQPNGTLVLRLEGAVDPDAPTVTITGPPCNPTCTTNATPFPGMTFSATDAQGVPAGGVTVACTPSCGTPVVTCPTCGPSATTVSGTIGGVNIVPDTVTTITVTVTDATAKTATDTLQVTHTSPPPPAELVLWWPFSENTGTTTADAGPSGTGGTLTNSPTWGPGCVGSGLSFVGASHQYVTNASFPWPAGQAVSISLWTKLPGGTENGTFKFGSTDNRLGAHVPWSDNVIYFDHGIGTSGRVSAPFGAHLNAWTHVVLVSNGTNLRAIYLNGVQVASSTTPTAPLPALTGLDVGLYNYAPGPLAYYHTGLLDEFRVYKGILTDSEILGLYNASSACPGSILSAVPTLDISTLSGTTGVPSVTINGTATDDTGVVSVTASCAPSCGAPAVSCVPACGATATNVTWSVVVPLTAGTNVITMQATDGVPQSVTKQITFTFASPSATNTGVPGMRPMQ